MADMAKLAEERKKKPEEVRQLLKDGNERFISGKAQTKVLDAFQRRQQIVMQTPFAVVLGCSDSRVPVEIVFDQGPGDLFVVRVAGNVAETSALATVEFAIKYLNISAIVVLGHEGCSAVQLAMGSWLNRMSEPTHVRNLIESIVPALGSQPETEEKERIRHAVQANVVHQVERLRRTDPLGTKERAGELALIPAYYEIATGRVEFL